MCILLFLLRFDVHQNAILAALLVLSPGSFPGLDKRTEDTTMRNDIPFTQNSKTWILVANDRQAQIYVCTHTAVAPARKGLMLDGRILSKVLPAPLIEHSAPTTTLSAPRP